MLTSKWQCQTKRTHHTCKIGHEKYCRGCWRCQLSCQMKASFLGKAGGGGGVVMAVSMNRRGLIPLKAWRQHVTLSSLPCITLVMPPWQWPSVSWQHHHHRPCCRRLPVFWHQSHRHCSTTEPSKHITLSPSLCAFWMGPQLFQSWL